jgi:hypothetical protein
MSINQLGRINFANLDNYTIHGSGLDLGEQYWENAVKELIGSRQAVGLIYGGAVTVVSALTVNIAKGLVLFNNGQLVAFDSQNVTLSAANGSNPRYDRIELAYSLANNTAGVDNDNNPVTLDKIHVGTAAALAGTPAGSPVAPTRTSGKLSLALIHVAANQVTLTSPDIDQTEDSARDISYTLLADSPYGIRFNRRLNVIQYTSDGTTWGVIATSSAPVQVNNAASPYTITAASPNIEVDSSAGAVSLNLPASPATGFVFSVKDLKGTFDSSATTIVRTTSAKIEGLAANFICSAPFGVWAFRFNGTDYVQL